MSACDICKRDEARLFAVIRDNVRTAKAHVCAECFHALQERSAFATVEEVSQQEFNAIEERGISKQTG